MDTEEFGKRYLEHEGDIANVLRGLGIYDEDLMHDTYISLYEYAQEAEIGDYVNAFVTFYKNQRKRQKKAAEKIELCGDYGMLVEKYDRIDEDDWKYREQVSDRVDTLMDELRKRPLYGERNRKQAYKILRLYREGLTFDAIAKKMKTSPQAVQQQLSRTIKKNAYKAQRM